MIEKKDTHPPEMAIVPMCDMNLPVYQGIEYPYQMAKVIPARLYLKIYPAGSPRQR
jgi:hypothetical protein